MRRTLRERAREVALVVGLVALAAVVGGYILANQRLTLPAWVPVLGQEVYEIEAELASAQAVTPGQGQTVNVAGVQVGEIAKVRLEGGRAILTLRLAAPEIRGRVFRDATVLLRPRTGLRDMVAELTPGTPRAGRLPAGGRIPIAQTLPDVNLDEILASLDADTRAYLRLLLAGGAEGLGGNGRALARGLRRLEPTARYLRRMNTALAERRGNVRRVIRNLSLLMGELGRKDDQLAGFVSSSNAVFEVLARQDANLRATLRALPQTLTTTREALASVEELGGELGPTLQALRPGARALGPSLREARPFLRATTPVISDELRPFARAARPTVAQLRPALRDLAGAAPDLTTTFTVVNHALNALAYNPPGRAEGYLFYLAWANHLGATLFATQDAHGPIRRGLVLVNCLNLQILENVAAVNEGLGALTGLLNPPDWRRYCRAQG